RPVAAEDDGELGARLLAVEEELDACLIRDALELLHRRGDVFRVPMSDDGGALNRRHRRSILRARPGAPAGRRLRGERRIHDCPSVLGALSLRARPRAPPTRPTRRRARAAHAAGPPRRARPPSARRCGLPRTAASRARAPPSPALTAPARVA